MNDARKPYTKTITQLYLQSNQFLSRWCCFFCFDCHCKGTMIYLLLVEREYLYQVPVFVTSVGFAICAEPNPFSKCKCRSVRYFDPWIPTLSLHPVCHFGAARDTTWRRHHGLGGRQDAGQGVDDKYKYYTGSEFVWSVWHCDFSKTTNKRSVLLRATIGDIDHSNVKPRQQES